MADLNSSPEPLVGCAECRDPKLLDFAFTMAFQPIVDAEERRVFSYEALVRGPAGESAGSILAKVNDSNRYRFDQSCRVKAIELASRGGIDCMLNINFLPRAVYRPETCIRATLEASEQFSFDHSRIIFEMTETEQLDNRDHVRSIFEHYSLRGIKTAIDDFGAGYSGLNLLAEFQPHYIKLDMALVRDVHNDPVRAAIIDGILLVCGKLNVNVIAEGIEEREEFEFLSQRGVRYFQGYYFARPELEAFPVVPVDLY